MNDSEAASEVRLYHPSSCSPGSFVMTVLVAVVAPHANRPHKSKETKKKGTKGDNIIEYVDAKGDQTNHTVGT
eukprot:6476982-Amphidinium_carterae.1